MKFWLIEQFCENIPIRNCVFSLNEAVILETLALLRSISLKTNGRGLSILSPFCDCNFFFDLSITFSQIISYFGELFKIKGLSHENITKKKAAENMLLIFADALENPFFSSQMSSSFIESGIIFMLLNEINNNSCQSEWREKASKLLSLLVKDESIRLYFSNEPLSILYCIINSADSFSGKMSIVMTLISTFEVIARDVVTHTRLFEGNIIPDFMILIKTFIETPSLYSTTLHESNEKCIILPLLNIFDIIASSKSSCIMLNDIKMESIIKSILKQKNHVVLHAVALSIMKKLNSQYSKKRDCICS
jgi:hypothetical protein